MSAEAEEEDYSLTTYKGWQQYANREPRPRPATLTRAELESLSPKALRKYNDERAIWHANLGPYKTTAVRNALANVDEIVAANRQDGDKVRTAIVIDADPGLGKTTFLELYCLEYYRRQMKIYGPVTKAGDQRVPLAHLRLTSTTTMRSLNSMLCSFYQHPAAHRGNAADLGARAAVCIRGAQTRLISVDDIHFLEMNRRDGREVANHFKYLANEFSATFLFAGVDIAKRGFLNEGLAEGKHSTAQIARRCTRFTLSPFSIGDAAGRTEWQNILRTFESNLILVDAYRGMLARDLADYLFARTQGHFASLKSLIERGCVRAITTGREVLDKVTLDEIRIDEAAEQRRPAKDAGMSKGMFSARVIKP